jgi:tRNA threonylcarbamoyladenosine biosynthesis protein TsaB
MMSNKLILAIESAIAGGSLALLRDGEVFAKWSDTSSLARSDELMVNIDEMFRVNHVSPGDLDLIAVSAGPGSFTGIRIGLATAMGLMTGFGIEMASVSALKAMAWVQPDRERIVTAVPVGRDAVCVQTFNKAGGTVAEFDEPRTIRQDDLTSIDLAGGMLVVHDALFDGLLTTKAVNFGRDIASAIGQYAYAEPATVTEPLFVSKSF